MACKSSHLYNGGEDEEDGILQAQPTEDVQLCCLHVVQCERDHNGGYTKDEGHCKGNCPPVVVFGGGREEKEENEERKEEEGEGTGGRSREDEKMEEKRGRERTLLHTRAKQ